MNIASFGEYFKPFSKRRKNKSKIEIMAPVNHWFPSRPAIKPLLLMWVRWGCLISYQPGGGFNLCFIFTSYLGKMNPFWRTYSSNSLKPPTSQSMEHLGAKLSELVEVSSLASWVGPGRWNDAVVSDVAWFGSFRMYRNEASWKSSKMSHKWYIHEWWEMFQFDPWGNDPIWQICFTKR